MLGGVSFRGGGVSKDSVVVIRIGLARRAVESLELPLPRQQVPLVLDGCLLQSGLFFSSGCCIQPMMILEEFALFQAASV